MNMRIGVGLFAVLLGTIQISAEPQKEFPKVDDSSFAEANGDRVIRLSTDVSAGTNEVWKVLSTAEGWKSFAVSFATLDLKVGGILETSYKAGVQSGDPDNIKNQIVAYIPGRMLAVRCIQTPSDFAHKEEFFSTATVLEIVSLGAEKSRVILTAMGYRPGEAYDTLYKHFRWGDGYTLDKLRERFESGKSTAPAESAELKGFNAKKKD